MSELQKSLKDFRTAFSEATYLQTLMDAGSKTITQLHLAEIWAISDLLERKVVDEMAEAEARIKSLSQTNASLLDSLQKAMQRL